MPITEEISVGGQSYFVSPAVAQQLATLPEDFQLSRLMNTDRFNRMSSDLEDLDVQEISIDGVSYFITPALANAMGKSMERETRERDERERDERERETVCVFACESG